MTVLLIVSLGIAALISPSHALFEIIAVSSVSEYVLPPLPYQYDGLEPYVDQATLRVHHTGHHAAYTAKLNTALSAWRNDREVADRTLAEQSMIVILQNLDLIPDTYKAAIRNNGGGFVNHNIYWSVMSPNPVNEMREPQGLLRRKLERAFGSFDKFQTLFTKEAASLFGSGYVWLSMNPKTDELIISTTVNQDSPISQGLHPILVIDIWEHSYYLKHQNVRTNYIKDWWLVVDWNKVNSLDNWWTNLYEKDEL